MSQYSKLIERPWQIFQTIDHGLVSLAYENSFIRYLPLINQTTYTSTNQLLHWYPISRPTVLLGAKDTRLPNFKEAVQYLKDNNYESIIRPHGGMAIVCDPGIVNVSWVQDISDHSLSIDEAYHNYLTFFQEIMASYKLNIEHYEMPGSYCPGVYDIILNGKKIGGTAQRRFKNGISTSAYLSVNGNQDLRSLLLKNFYLIGQGDESYPQINLDSMTTLEQELKTEFSADSLYQLIIDYIQTNSQLTLVKASQKPELSMIFEQQYEQLQQRNQSLL